MMPRADLIRADRALWRAVISQAISDAMLGLATVTPAERTKALAWLTSNGSDFRRVCILADVEPDRVRAYAMAEIARAKTAPKRKPSPPLPVDADGNPISILALGKQHGIHQSTLRQRLNRGLTLEEALTVKPRQRLTGGRSKLQVNEQGPAGVHPHKIAPNWSFSA